MSLSQVEAATESDQVEQPVGNLRQAAWRRLRRDPVAITGFVLIAMFIVVAVLAPLIAPYDPRDTPGAGTITPTNIPGPSAEHWFGLDEQGRDELSRVIYGARQSLLVGVVAMLLGMAGGMVLGVLAGAFGRWVDSVVMRIVDIMLSIPGLLMAIAIAAVLGRSLTSVMIAIAAVNVPIFARLLRGQMMSQRESDYVLAARSLGVRRRSIVLSHVLPNSMSPVIVQATLTLATAIIEAAALSFLGLGGADPAVPEWGRMLASTQRYLASAPHLALFPGLAIMVAALGFTLIGERLREALDPKYRR
ncbi:peptide/nickel transport system permease protein [Haloactinopolyspora alba]|uniref:Peptide/nickel transport system permease protein n=1 Tax=Haloactinopolyspora alba TaxID=648780 RepID=A0A2P8D9C5_9ACTN|nr:ABC transporter permease [Haloactinopolyspora alba]PSK93826.1 peptide/nickel transport system permease protein [Haloactinopolyspora alba]